MTTSPRTRITTLAAAFASMVALTFAIESTAAWAQQRRGSDDRHQPRVDRIVRVDRQ